MVQNNINYYTICARDDVNDVNLDFGFELQDKKLIFTSYNDIDKEKMTQEDQEMMLNLLIAGIW